MNIFFNEVNKSLIMTGCVKIISPLGENAKLGEFIHIVDISRSLMKERKIV